MIQKAFIVGVFVSIFSTTASAQVKQIDYVGKFGVFGTVAMLKTKITKSSNRYEINTDIELRGIAKMLMDNHIEHHISKGHMVNGRMVSDVYTIKQNRGTKRTNKEYKIDHKRKKVIKRVREWKKGKLVKDNQEMLKFYAKDDLLTLYFNLDHALKNKKKGKTYLFKAVGLEKQEGKAYITVPNSTQLPSYQQDLGNTAAQYAKVLIHQRNFRKKKGDILLSIAKDGFIEKSVIKDVLLYGDAKIERAR